MPSGYIFLDLVLGKHYITVSISITTVAGAHQAIYYNGKNADSNPYEGEQLRVVKVGKHKYNA
jgi:hypothetical protein